MEKGPMSTVNKILCIQRTLRFYYTVIIMAKTQKCESIKSYSGLEHTFTILAAGNTEWDSHSKESCISSYKAKHSFITQSRDHIPH